MDNQPDQQVLQQKYFEFQFLEQQLKQMQQNLTLLEKQMEELETLKERIKDLEKAKEGTRCFAPIGSGVYFDTEIKDTSKFLVNIGSEIMVKKSPKETSALLEKQQKELKQVLETLKKETDQAFTKHHELQHELQALSQAAEAQKEK